ncbi:uncharacterized protein LOC113217758 [Frankliniella occidentalis]|uniref:Uncharacterized protein LOC113217758 n=1 Tax=Frankliniella occidentalis TaxID=133901 RepID=A0A9C6X7Q1_FRAOC|nr:uncharacterized protein LOC113217758 [Frankliniella occidentalis]
MLHQLNLAVTDPARLVGQHCVHGVNERMRRFMDHFEKVLEMPTEPGWLPGAKALDVLDCALDVRRRVLKEAVEVGPAGGRLLHLRLRYSMPRAYFVALPLGEEVSEASRAPQKGGAGGGSSSRDSREERRLVFLRLRRLVQHHNEYTLQKLHRDREEALCGRVSSMVLPTSFAGYGESGGRFFYYGNLNEGAYDFCSPLTGAPAEPVNPPATYAFVVAGQGGGGGQPAAQQGNLWATIELKTCAVPQKPLIF